jgi:hypothetical protein
MANNYTQGATLINSVNLVAPDKIDKDWNLLCAAFDRAEECASQKINFPYEAPGDGSDCGHSGLDIRLLDDGHLYISSGDESFNDDLFIKFIGTCVRAGWVNASVGISLAFFCDKLRADQFGGYHIRVLLDGSSVVIGTGSLESVSDDTLKAMSAGATIEALDLSPNLEA